MDLIQTEAAATPGWQYLRLQVPIDAIDASDGKIAELGREGWELVAVSAADSRYAWGAYLQMWFKRPL